MTTPSVTLRSLKNIDTGIDISVPRFQEEEAPLGGISILYEISVLTTLDLFKTRLHRGEDVVHFSIFKAYREIEDLSNKLNKKYPKAGLPPVPKASTADKYTSDEKVEALDIFMSAVAKNLEICHSSMFTQFIGINSQRLPSFNIPQSSPENASNASVPSSDQKEQEVFPKMKNVEKNATKLSDSVPQSVKNMDLFDEIKVTGGSQANSNFKGSASSGLFDEFDDDNLFSTKPPEVKETELQQKNNKTEVKVPEKPVPRKKIIKTIPEKVDDSEILIKERKHGDISLFEEQDFGDYITKDEEALFLVTAPSQENKKNFLLTTNNEILSPENENDINENLDDLLNLAPLPLSPNAALPENDVIDATVTAKPVPLPRKKSLSKVELDVLQKPEVMPRKVFLNKEDDLQKPATPPSIPPKPVLSLPGSANAKPKPPPKPKRPPKKTKPNLQKDNEVKTTDLDAENANKPEANDNNLSSVTSLADELKELDILKYIEQEEKSLDSNLSLFD